MKGVEFYMIIKIPSDFGLDDTEVRELVQVLETVGIGKYGSLRVLEFRHIGTNIED